MLITAVNAASRAFLGGVRVRLHENGPMGVGWVAGMDMATAIETYGGEIVESLGCEHPTLVIGNVDDQPLGSVVLHATWEGWSGGVVEETERTAGRITRIPVSGECLQQRLECRRRFRICVASTVAGRRSTGLSLWEPQCDWRDEPAYGEPCLYLPKRLWLIGLGHLGQAYAMGHSASYPTATTQPLIWFSRITTAL